MAKFLLATMLLLLGCDADEKTPFALRLEISAASSAPEGFHYRVGGAAAGETWSQRYADLADACAQMAQAPLSVECLGVDDQPCGQVQLSSVCCWAPNLLSSPIVKGTVYVEFAANGTSQVQEGPCVAQDGSSAHGDGEGPDAGL